jgi:CobQ-like glutamine amidotransferase family enzyme
VRADVAFCVGAVVDGFANQGGELVDAVFYSVDYGPEFDVVVGAVYGALLAVFLFGAGVARNSKSA